MPFKAPSPEVLFASPFSVITASPTSISTPGTGSSTFNQNIENPTTSSITSTIVQTVAVAATPTGTTLADNFSRLSTGAKAAIGVSTVVLFVIVLGIVSVWRRRSHRHQQQLEQREKPFMQHSSIMKAPPGLRMRQLHEVDGLERTVGTQSCAELPYSNTN